MPCRVRNCEYAPVRSGPPSMATTPPPGSLSTIPSPCPTLTIASRSLGTAASSSASVATNSAGPAGTGSDRSGLSEDGAPTVSWQPDRPSTRASIAPSRPTLRTGIFCSLVRPSAKRCALGLCMCVSMPLADSNTQTNRRAAGKSLRSLLAAGWVMARSSHGPRLGSPARVTAK